MTENNRPTVNDSGECMAPPIDENFRLALALLWQAYMYAQDAGANLWDFAMEIETLYETGLTISELRWLVVKGLGEHGQEMSVYGDNHRSFRSSEGLNFVPASCFVLTSKGAEFADKVLKEFSADN